MNRLEVEITGAEPERHSVRADKHPDAPVIRTVCAWCDTVILEGTKPWPVSHGMCTSCYMERTLAPAAAAAHGELLDAIALQDTAKQIAACRKLASIGELARTMALRLEGRA